MPRRLLSIPLAVLALALAGPAVAQPQPKLSLAGRSPLKVHGTGFHRHERVRVVAQTTDGAKLTRHARATRSGRFTVTFTGQPASRCGRLRVSATGSRGSHAMLTGKLPECMAP